MLILDGYDEISEDNLKRSVTSDIRDLSFHLTKAKFILTSRTAEYNYPNIENTEVFEILPLSDEKIGLLVSKWLKDDARSEEFLEQLKKSPYYDTAIKPLTLAHICAIYEREKGIPDKPKTIYWKIIHLLLEEWNLQKDVIKKSKYANFEADRKFEFLSNLSYLLTVEFNKTNFSKENLISCYKLICNNFNLPVVEVDFVVDELESHNGLFLKSGYNSYEFAHKSLQEYLAAEFIVRSVKIPNNRKLLLNIPNELAVALAVSYNPSGFFKILIIDRLSQADVININFIKPFLERVIIDKPDFSCDLDLAFTFLYIFTLAYKELHMDEPENFREITQILDELFKFENVKNSLILLKRDFTLDVKTYSYLNLIKLDPIFRKNIEREKNDDDEIFGTCDFLFAKREYFNLKSNNNTSIII